MVVCGAPVREKGQRIGIQAAGMICIAIGVDAAVMNGTDITGL